MKYENLYSSVIEPLEQLDYVEITITNMDAFTTALMGYLTSINPPNNPRFMGVSQEAWSDMVLATLAYDLTKPVKENLRSVIINYPEVLTISIKQLLDYSKSFDYHFFSFKTIAEVTHKD